MIIACPNCASRVRVPESRLHQVARCAKCKSELAPLGKPVPVEDLASFDALVRDASLPVLVDFWAAWCGPCRQVAPELEKLAASRVGKLVIAKVDTDALPALGSRYQIASIPTLVLFSDGREKSRVSGAMPASALASKLGI